MSDLVNRLRGVYAVGPEGVYGTRDFADFIPPISLEAATRIEELEAALSETYEQVYDNPAIDALIDRVLNH